MFLYDDAVSDGFLTTLSRQKISFQKNNVKSLKKCQSKWKTYMGIDSSLRMYIDKYLKVVSKDLGVYCSTYYYKSKKSEAYYITITIDTVKRKLRLANHDTVDSSHFDENVWISDFKSMKAVYKCILRFIDSCIIEWRSRVTIDNFETYFNLALKKKQEYDTNLKIKESTELTLEEYNNQLKDKLLQHKNYSDAIDYLKEIIELISRQHIEHIEKLLNSAIKTIFYDKNYSIKMEISEMRNTNSLNIYLVESTDEGEITTDIKNNGFGIQGVVGFILQVYFIMYHKLEPILIMDEAMSNLSSQYIPYFKELIDAMAKQYNFTFVLVAHDPRYVDIADYKYEVKNGEVRKV